MIPSNNFKGIPLQSRATRNTFLREHDFVSAPNPIQSHRVMFCGVCAIGLVLIILLLQGVI